MRRLRFDDCGVEGDLRIDLARPHGVLGLTSFKDLGFRQSRTRRPARATISPSRAVVVYGRGALPDAVLSA